MALLLGESEKAEQLISNMDRRLAAVVCRHETATGCGDLPGEWVHHGKHSLINDILTLAGFRHLSAEMAMDQAGFLPLEKMIAADPALIIFGQYKPNHPSIAHQLLEHPALKSLLASRAGGKSRDSIIIPSNLWNCGGPFIAEAVEMLARKHKTLSRAGVSP